MNEILKNDDGVLKTRWSVHAYDKKKQEWTEAWNEAYDMQASQNCWQAERAKITPSRKRGIERNYEKIVVLGDAHISYRNINGELEPTQDERALLLARWVIAEINPDKIIVTGDMLDNAELSTFRPDSDHYIGTLGQSIQRIHDYYAELRADNPKSQIIEVGSNHAQRIKKRLIDDLPQMYNVRQAGSGSKYPVMSYPFMANLEHVGVDFYSGEQAEYLYEGNVFKHSFTKNLDKLRSEYQGVNTFGGHWHVVNMNFYSQTERRSRELRIRELGNYTCGVLCRLDGTVSSTKSEVDDINEPVKRYENWTQGIIEVDVDESGSIGRYISFRNGIARYNDKIYDANEVVDIHGNFLTDKK